MKDELHVWAEARDEIDIDSLVAALMLAIQEQYATTSEVDDDEDQPEAA